MSIKNKRCLLIGWDAADWKVISPLLDAGKLPNLQKLIEGGVMGNLATLQPALSPMLWTSIATGKRPYKHGIHGFSEPDPVTGGIRPVTNLSRTTKAIWNILNQEDKNTITVGWWPSNPAEPLSKGVMVSDDYQMAFGNQYDPTNWPMKPGTVHPERLIEKLARCRFHPAELSEEDLFAFMPDLKGLSQEELDRASKDPRLQSLMKIIADCTSIQSAATALMASEPWDLMSVYYDAIDHFGHAFMKFHPPQREGIDDWEYRLFNHVIEAGYRYHDMMLGTLMQMAGDETTIILISDHGFHPDDLRLSQIPSEPAGPAAEHRQFGIVVANGPELRKDERIYGANLLDICPTLLHLFGLPVGEDMDGKVLLDLYQNPPNAIDRIPSWDKVEGDHGMHPPDRQITAEDSKAAIDQLVALGYIDEPDLDQEKAVAQTIREQDFNLAQALFDGGIYTEAADIFNRLYERWPMEHRFGRKLATCYHALGKIGEMRETVTLVIQRRIKDAHEAQIEADALGLENPEILNKEKQAFAQMDQREKKKFIKERENLLDRLQPNLFALQYLEATADFAEKKYETALTKLSKLDSDYGSRRKALVLRGDTLAKLRRWPEAQQAYDQTLQIDPETPGALNGLTRIHLAQKNFREAITNARNSLGLLFFQPKTHYMLGMAHYRLGEFEQAENSFQLTTHQAPLFLPAWRMLAQLAQFHFHHPGQLLRYKEQIKKSREQIHRIQQGGKQPPEKQGTQLTEPGKALFHMGQSSQNDEVITIVSGLPRSGTSLMMQILEALDIPIFTDGHRLADDSNKNGYYEHDKVSGLLKNSDSSWLSEARGSAIKIVAPLLSSIPAPDARLQYRVIFMERDIAEIIQSQATMLKRLGKTTPDGDPSKAYRQQLSHAVAWVNNSKIPALAVSYSNLIHDAEHSLLKITRFLNIPEPLPHVKEIIDSSLYRIRNSETA